MQSHYHFRQSPNLAISQLVKERQISAACVYIVLLTEYDRYSMDSVLDVAMNIIIIFGAVSLILASVLIIVLIVVAIKLLHMTSTVKTKVDQTAHIMNVVSNVVASPFVSFFGSGDTKYKTKRRER